MFNLMFIIAGESFRDGGQYSRKRDTAWSYDQQKIATDSHIQLIQQLQNLNINIDLYIESYSSKYANDLIHWYSKHINKYQIYYRFHDKLLHGARSELCTKCIHYYNIDKYDAIFIIRPDIYFKPYFLQIFNVDYNKIVYPTRLVWRINEITVNDAMIFIPKKFFSFVKSYTIKLLHRAVPQYMTHGCEKSNFGFMIPSIHDTDSQKDYNPLYKLISRKESFFWKLYGYEVDKNNISNVILTNKTYEFDDWSLLNNNIDHKIKKQIININNVYEWLHQENNNVFIFKGIMEFDIKDPINNKISLWPGRDQSFFKIENNQLLFFDMNHKMTSIHEFIDNAWHGKFLHKDGINFIARPLIRK